VTAALIGVGVLVHDRSGLLQVDRFTDGLDVWGGDRLVLDNGVLIDVSGSTPRYAVGRLSSGTYVTDGETALVVHSEYDPAEVEIIGRRGEWAGSLPGRLVAADVTADSDLVVVTSRDGIATVAAFDGEGWRELGRLTAPPIDVVSQADRIALLYPAGLYAIATGSQSSEMTHLELPTCQSHPSEWLDERFPAAGRRWVHCS
jgi:hypothetical protein